MGKQDKEKFDVIVIGSGISGLGAALALKKMRKSVLVVEAHDYVGGRIRTIDLGDIKCDLGATWIEGVDKNPIANLADEFGITTIVDDWDESEKNAAFAFDEKTKKKIDNYDMIEEYIDQFIDDDYLESLRDKLPDNASVKDAFDKFCEEKKFDEFDKRIASYSIEERHIGMDYGTSAKRMSLEYFEEEEEFEGDYHVFPRGFSQITDGLAKDLDIRLSTPVKNIDYSGSRVIVTTSGNQVFEGKQVIVTASIGVLKANVIKFDPPLPQNKMQSINRLDMAISDKIFLTFDEKFWDTYEIAYVSIDPKESIQYLDFTYAYGVPTLIGNFTGYSPLHYKKDEELVALSMKQLSLAFDGIEIPQPSATYVTRWQDDPYSRGSFSFIPVGASFGDMRAYAKSVDKKVFFAGEGTNPMYFGTTHGAFMSGLRAAKEVKKIGKKK